MVVNIAFTRAVNRLKGWRMWALWAAIALAGRIALLPLVPIPKPAVHDEFSYLVGADTLSHGRLSNPAPRVGEYFESPQVIVRPVYASKYLPGQITVLAAGQTLLGHPFWGVLAGYVLMAGAFVWMAQGWVGNRWAAFAGFLAAFCFQAPMYWSNSYWGGCLTAAGAALVLGVLGRIRRGREPGWYPQLGAGWWLLLWTRPWEGGVFSIATGLAIIWTIARNPIPLPRLRRLALANLAIAAAAFVSLGIYSRGVTGNPLRLPYLLHDDAYSMTPIFWLQPLRPQTELHHARLEPQHGPQGWDVGNYNTIRRRGWAERTGFLLLRFYSYSMRPWILAFDLLLIGVFVLIWRSKAARFLAGIGAVCFAALLAVTWNFAHYSAPFLVIVVLLMVMAARSLWYWRPRRTPAGPALLLLYTALSGFVWFQQLRAEMTKPYWLGPRDQMIAELARKPGRHLAVVRYPYPKWKVDKEWVYNSADLEGQKVLLAHDLGEAETAALAALYPNHSQWLVTLKVDGDEISGYRLEPLRNPSNSPVARQ